MIFEQYYLSCLAHASYLIGDPDTRRAIVVDPQRDIAQYLDTAHLHGLAIDAVFLTHFHADFVAGHLELRERTGARIHLGSRAEAEYEFTAVHHGHLLQLGSIKVEVLETPGHTPESICLLVRDGSDEPARLLTGDTLFVGDVGRPDLLASVGATAEELARQLYHSLHERILRLPDETRIYPAHGAGSLCGKNLGSETSSTLGQQRRYNYALRPMSEVEFVSLVTRNLPAVPAYFAYDAEVNKKERPTLETAIAQGRKPLTVEKLLAHRDAGGIVLDVRDPVDHAAAHLRGSINIGLGGKYATWAGSLLDRSRPIALIADPGLETEAATRLGRIGFDQVVGYLDGRMAALSQHPAEIGSFERHTAQGLAEELTRADPPLIIDVRAVGERREKRIPASVHIPLEQIEARLAEIPRDQPLVLQCAGGYRSMIATSLLRRHGYYDATDLIGGITAWEVGGLLLDREEER